jgi:glycosyltransferase 2 family protein
VTHKQKLQLLIGVVVAAGLLALFLRGQNWAEIGHAFRNADPRCLAGLVAATIVCYAVRAWRWGLLYRPLAPVPFRDLQSATYVGFMSGLLVPRAGEVLRPYLIARRHPVSTSAGFATIIIERLIDLITVLSMFAAYLYLLPVPPQERPGALLTLPVIKLDVGRGITGIAIVALLVFCIVFFFWAKTAVAVADWVLARFPAKIGTPLGKLLHSFSEGLAVVKAPPALLALMFGQSLLLWLSIAVGFYLNNLAFGIVLPPHSTFLLIAFLTVGVAVPTPGNVGGFHLAYLLAMACYNVPQELGAAAGISAHALTNALILIAGLVCLAREGLTLGKVAELAGEKA